MKPLKISKCLPRNPTYATYRGKTLTPFAVKHPKDYIENRSKNGVKRIYQ